MAKHDYSADSSVSPLPLLQPALPRTGNVVSFKIAIPAQIIEHLSAIITYLIEATPYVGERCTIGRRLHQHDEVRDRRGIWLSPTPVV